MLAEVKDELPWDAIVSRRKGKRAQRDTVRDWFGRYLEHKRTQRRAGAIGATRLRDCERFGRLHILAHAPTATKTLHALEDGDMDELFAWMAERGLQASSRRAVRGVLSNFFRYVERHKRRAGVPRWLAPELPHVRLDEREIDVLTEDLQREIIGAMQRAQQGIFLAMALSIRPSEARALRVSDYQRRGLSITRACKGPTAGCEIGTTKTRRPRWLPLDDSAHWAAAELLTWLHEAHAGSIGDRLLFAGGRPGLPLSHKAVSKTWERACARAGAPHVKLYEGTRHTLASQLCDLGASDDEVRDVLGHRRGTRSIESYRRVKLQVSTVSAMSRFGRPEREPVRSPFARAPEHP